MYTLERIEKIWLAAKPLYYRLVEGEKANGLHRHTDFIEFKKTDNLDDATRALQSKALWDRFIAFLDIINDGYYTVIIQANKSASASAAPYKFAKGDISALPEPKATATTVGSLARQNTEGGNWGMAMGAQSPMLIMVQMMQQQNAQQLAMVQQYNAQQLATMQQLLAKEMELQKMGQAKNAGDRVFEVLEKPYLWGLLAKFAPAQSVAIGRAQAAVNEVVPRPSAQETPEPQPKAPSAEQVNRLQSLLQKVAEANPGEDPVAVLDDGFDKVQAFLAMQG